MYCIVLHIFLNKVIHQHKLTLLITIALCVLRYCTVFVWQTTDNPETTINILVKPFGGKNYFLAWIEIGWFESFVFISIQFFWYFNYGSYRYKCTLRAEPPWYPREAKEGKETLPKSCIYLFEHVQQLPGYNLVPMFICKFPDANDINI